MNGREGNVEAIAAVVFCGGIEIRCYSPRTPGTSHSIKKPSRWDPFWADQLEVPSSLLASAIQRKRGGLINPLGSFVPHMVKSRESCVIHCHGFSKDVCEAPSHQPRVQTLSAGCGGSWLENVFHAQSFSSPLVMTARWPPSCSA